MKNISAILITLLVSLVLMSNMAYTQNNRIFNLEKGDSITLMVEARGGVQWEKSADNQIWGEISGKNHASLSLVAEQNAYYRARISEPECDQIYSETSFVRMIPEEDRMNYDSIYKARVRIGVMRWDAWAPDDLPGSAYNQCMECMKPTKWNDLGYWPWWATLDGEGNLLELNENRLEVMEKENQYAYESRIDYWAFFRYNGDSHPMNQQFRRYLESSTKRLVLFCFIASPQIYIAGINEIRTMVNYMKDPQYFKVPDGRPLLYFYVAHMSLEDVRDYFSHVKQEASSAGIEDPYIVLFNNDWEWSGEDVADLGQDAYSEYGPKPGRSVEGSPYQRMIDELPPLWSDWASGINQIVPALSQQWDPRPYAENPPTWWPNPDNRWFLPPTKDEFMQNVQNAVDFVKEHIEKGPSRSIIIKEWNGFTEGSTIWPSIKNGTMYIDALKEVIRKL